MTDIATSISVLPALANAPQTVLQDPQNRASAAEATDRSLETGEQTVEAVSGAADKPALDSSTDERKSAPQDGRGGLVDLTV